MVRKSVLLATILVMIMAAVNPASAQEERVVAAGTLEDTGVTAWMYGSHYIVDEASGTPYALGSEQEDLLDSYEGQRVIVHGTVDPDTKNGQIEGGPPLLYVYRVETADLTVSSCTDPAGCQGTGERDRIFGTGGGDAIRGHAGDDVLYGLEDKDKLYGGTGNDVLYGDSGKDKLYGGKGDDAIHADDGTKDRVSCGGGADTVIADANDRVASDCETVTRPEELEGGALATFEDYGERFRVWVTNPETIQDLYRLQIGEGDATIVSGRLLENPGQGNHNASYNWHLDPQDIRMAEVTVPECYASPSYVEENFDAFVSKMGRHYCSYGDLVGLRDYTGEELEPPAPTS